MKYVKRSIPVYSNDVTMYVGGEVVSENLITYGDPISKTELKEIVKEREAVLISYKSSLSRFVRYKMLLKDFISAGTIID